MWQENAQQVASQRFRLHQTYKNVNTKGNLTNITANLGSENKHRKHPCQNLKKSVEKELGFPARYEIESDKLQTSQRLKSAPGTFSEHTDHSTSQKTKNES